MGKVLFIVLMCILPAVLCTIIHTATKKEKWEIKFDYRVTFFYFTFFLTIISLFKIMVRPSDIFLLESFSEIGFETLTHYVPILMVISMIIPMVVRRITINVIYYYDSMFFFLWSLLYFVIGGVHNVLTVTVFGLSLIISIILVLFCKKEVVFFDKHEIGNVKGYISSIILFGIITTYVYIPQETFLANIKEMVISYNVYASYVMLGSVILALVYILGVFLLLTKDHCYLYVVLFFAINLVGYLQTNFLNGEMNALDGMIQKWDDKTIVSNVMLWILLFLLIIFIRFFSPFKDKSKKIIQIVAIYISLMQIVSLVILTIGTEKNQEAEYAFEKDYMLELDEENNVIVFVLDWLDQQILEDVVESDATVLNGFKDFTWYTNATSHYAYTYMSIPYLLTGMEWQPGMDEYEYYMYALEKSNYLKSIHNEGFDIGIYTDHYFANESLRDVVKNVSVSSKKTIPFVGLFDLVEKSARYRMAPFVLKEEYIYYDWEYYKLRYDNQYSIDYDEQFYAELMDKGVTVSKSSSELEGSFRLYHMHGAHVPYRINSNIEVIEEQIAQQAGISNDELLLEQTKGCLKIVATYIEQMKQTGLFENATVIITADHGQNLYMTEKGRIDNRFDLTSTPIMFVKTAGSKEQDEIKISSAPVSHREVIAQVLRSVGIDSDMRIFSEIGEDEVREREFIRGRCNDIPFKKYVINGDARDEKSWREVPLQ